MAKQAKKKVYIISYTSQSHLKYQHIKTDSRHLQSVVVDDVSYDTVHWM